MNKGSQEHLPARLWWVLACLTVVWGFNWTAMKVAIADIAPFTFRTLCLGLGSGVLFAFQGLHPAKIEGPRNPRLSDRRPAAAQRRRSSSSSHRM